MSCPTLGIEICQGADFSVEIQVLDDDGVPVDLTGYDDLRAELRSGAETPGPTLTLEAEATVTIVGAATNGTVEVFIGHDDTYAIEALTGFWTCQIEDTTTPGSRLTIARGTYTLDPTSIATP